MRDDLHGSKIRDKLRDDEGHRKRDILLVHRATDHSHASEEFNGKINGDFKPNKKKDAC